MRTVAGTEAALGGAYPAACLYMQTSWVETHRGTVQKLVNAFVRTLHFIATHDAAEIAALMPSDYYIGDSDMYVKALADGKGMFTADGRMPEGGPETVLAVMSAIKENVRSKTIDLSRTYTTEFVDKANESLAR